MENIIVTPNNIQVKREITGMELADLFIIKHRIDRHVVDGMDMSRFLLTEVAENSKKRVKW